MCHRIIAVAMYRKTPLFYQYTHNDFRIFYLFILKLPQNRENWTNIDDPNISPVTMITLLVDVVYTSRLSSNNQGQGHWSLSTSGKLRKYGFGQTWVKLCQLDVKKPEHCL